MNVTRVGMAVTSTLKGRRSCMSGHYRDPFSLDEFNIVEPLKWPESIRAYVENFCVSLRRLLIVKRIVSSKFEAYFSTNLDHRSSKIQKILMFKVGEKKYQVLRGSRCKEESLLVFKTTVDSIVRKIF